MRRALPIILALAAAAAAALAANLLLLGYATSRNDPVGKLTPQAAVITTPLPAATTPTRTHVPTVTTAPPRTTTDRSDDHGGHGGDD